MAYASGTLFLGSPATTLSLFPATATGNPTAAATFSGVSTLTVAYPGGVAVDTSVSPPVVYLVDYGSLALNIIQTTGAPPNLAPASVVTIQGPRRASRALSTCSSSSERT